MKPVSAFATALVLLGLGSRLPAQILHITNAPFTASLSFTRDGGRTYSTEQLARASDGSTYVASRSSDGRAIRITIDDVPNNREIVLMPSPPSYTYRLVPPPGGSFRTDTIENYRQQLQQCQKSFVQLADIDKQSGSQHAVSLGVRQQEGMTLFGRRDDLTSATGEKSSTERWDSDLGLALSIKRTVAATGKVSSWSVTELYRIEPDPTLFEIPADYLPHSDPLRDAKTVFIDNQTGNDQVTAGAKLSFTKGWKHMTLASSKEDADLTAVFTNTVRYDLGPAVHSIEMTGYLPNSEIPVFTSHLGLNPIAATRGMSTQQDKSAAMNCVNELWDRIGNTHIGLVGVSQAIRR
jgi:hypothetical protein